MSDLPPIGPKPRQARGVAARRKVYEEAVKQFAAKGVEATRIEDVVAEAGVSWGTFYRWFPRKQDVLLEAAVLHVRERVLPVIQSSLPDPDKPCRETSLEAFCALLEPGSLPPHLHGEVLREVVESRERFAQMLDDGEHPLIFLFAQVTAEGQKRGEVRSDLDPYSLTGALLGGTVFAAVHGYYGAFRGLPGVEPTVDLRDMVSRFFGIIWRGMESAPEPIEGT